jgi:ubiquinone/menaquinone biosynthesis C-methylase UbiE
MEPFIHSIAQFTRYHGKRLLEVGVGAGTDHLQWARAGAICHGVDLTAAAIETTRRRLELYGQRSELKHIDAETLPYPDATFDVVYSWGVIHHSERPEAIIAEIHRVLKPGGRFIGMMYGRHSVVTLKLWFRHALLRVRPWRSFSDVIWHHMESIGTKAYTRNELARMMSAFRIVELIPTIAHYDRIWLPHWLTQFFPDNWGWYIGFRITK